MDQSQGQSISERLGIFLFAPAFVHGRLCVAFSRASSFQNVRCVEVDSGGERRTCVLPESPAFPDRCFTAEISERQLLQASHVSSSWLGAGRPRDPVGPFTCFTCFAIATSCASRDAPRPLSGRLGRPSPGSPGTVCTDRSAIREPPWTSCVGRPWLGFLSDCAMGARDVARSRAALVLRITFEETAARTSGAIHHPTAAAPNASIHHVTKGRLPSSRQLYLL